jgi:phosphatidylethanolamine-binding protein (PEBP) family uncharacterized protein
MKIIQLIVVASVVLVIDGSAAIADSPFTASFKWCSKEPQSTTSPVFALSGVPKGTTKLSLNMSDHSSSYRHGGGDVSYKGKNTIPCGAIADGWVGPFPPNGQVHTYEFSIKALDANGNTLGVASATRDFPEK